VEEVVISEVAENIRSGSIIVYPTDTIYGIGCDPFNLNAVTRLKRIKKRSGNPLPLLVGSTQIAEEFGLFSSEARRLADTFWPGQLTIVVKKKVVFSDAVTCGLGVVGLRVPNHPFLLKLLLHLRTPIVGTSANISGAPSSTTVYEAERQLGSEVDLFIDGGSTLSSTSSTVVDASTHRIRLLRPGVVPFGAIEKVLDLR
jgi:L-threonylcarbamoyladenylate synthase